MPSTRDLLGVPALPPPAATAAGNRLRAAVGRLYRGAAPPPVRIIEGVLGMLDTGALAALCDAGVPDALTGPTTPAELAARLGVDHDRLERLLRFGAARGWLVVDRRDRVRPNAVTRFLRTDHPGGWRAWVDFAGGPEIVAAVASLRRLDADDVFAATHGAPFFEWMAAHPERQAAFNGAMAAGARMHGLTLAAALPWPAPTTVCDVGGGTGALLATLADLVPGLTGTVLDLPDVVAHAVSHPRVEAVAGNAFEAVPAGFDTYLLVNVLHDWADAEAEQLLRTTGAAAAAGSTGRVVVVEAEAAARPRDDIAARADVLMAALTPGGRERDRAAFERLGAAAGLRLDAVVPLASGDAAFVLVASSRA